MKGGRCVFVSERACVRMPATVSARARVCLCA